MSLEKVVNKNLDEFILSIKLELAKTRNEGRKINNTKNASNSLAKNKINETKYQVTGLEYLEFLNKGRGSGKFPNLKALRLWVKTKFKITNEKEINQIAFLVGRKIAKEGTEIFNDNSQGIELNKQTKILAKNLAKDLATEFVANITERLDKFNQKRIK